MSRACSIERDLYLSSNSKSWSGGGLCQSLVETHKGVRTGLVGSSFHLKERPLLAPAETLSPKHALSVMASFLTASSCIGLESEGTH